jgi:PTS system nitrogen regulatory IIA component
MKIVEFLNEKAVSGNIEATDKEGSIRELVDLLAKAEGIRNKEELVKSLINRETLGSTGIGQGVGIPHAKTNAVKRLVAAFGISHQGVSFDALDGEPVYIFFLLVAPEDSAGPHLKGLARISRLLKDKFFRESLKALTDEKAIIKLIREEDAKKP